MMLRCPVCRERLREHRRPAGFTCANDHSFPQEEGVLSLLHPAFAAELHAFLETFEPYRNQIGQRITDPAVYPGLPFNRREELEWRLRTYDVIAIEKLLAGRETGRILDIGAWNGWLSNVLAGRGHIVTAVDYFTDKFDGLGARRFYQTNWQAIQLDLRDLSLLDEQFDLVVVNRCLQFFADPPAYVDVAGPKVAPGGRLLLTGLAFFRDPAGKQQQMRDLQAELARRDIPTFKPMKGYLDTADRQRLLAMGVALHAYPQLRRANLKARLIASAPAYYYGVWEPRNG